MSLHNVTVGECVTVNVTVTRLHHWYIGMLRDIRRDCPRVPNIPNIPNVPEYRT